MSRLVVLAIGGNSFIKDPGHPTVEDQLQVIQETAEHIADIIADGWDVAIIHGNGPQVGFILKRSAIALEHDGLHPVPLKNCVADTQGSLGYQLQESLHNTLVRRGIEKTVVSLVTMVEVDPHDPSLSQPSKPIGIFYGEEKAAELSRRYPGWKFAEDSGRGFRQVVPSPVPRRIVELPAIRALVDQGFCVVAAGGGGIPEVPHADGSLRGVEAVVDKDLTAALLARGLEADVLLIVTTVDQVYVDYGKPTQRPLERLTTREARALMEQGHFAPGSMGPKVQAAIDFLANGGKTAIITSPRMMTGALRGQGGTVITG
ncbi:MAG TPA: carbamate kinase [Candidatus Methylomirabilis sp.]|nr:carbamate kinase [Candidatus Methylomirabilis sp.]